MIIQFLFLLFFKTNLFIPFPTLECPYRMIYLVSYFINFFFFVYHYLFSTSVRNKTKLWLDIESGFKDIPVIFFHLKTDILFFSKPLLLLSPWCSSLLFLTLQPTILKPFLSVLSGLWWSNWIFLSQALRNFNFVPFRKNRALYILY